MFNMKLYSTIAAAFFTLFWPTKSQAWRTHELPRDERKSEEDQDKSPKGRYFNRRHPVRNGGLTKHDHLKDWRQKKPSGCIRQARDLIVAATTTDDNTVITICDSTTIPLESGIHISASNVTLRCEDKDCRIELGEANMIVTGDSFTLSAIDFTEGSGYPASQLAITGNGAHLIEGSGFYNGRGGLGMLCINTLGDAVIRNSDFCYGYIGLGIINAGKVTIESSAFRGNDKYGLYTDLEPPRSPESDHQTLNIQNSVFVQNKRTGIMSSNLGLVPTLSIIDTEFSGNGDEGLGPYYGMAGDFSGLASFKEVIVSGNFGTNQPSGSSNTCDGFFFEPYHTDEGEDLSIYCIDIDDEITGSF